MSKVVQKLVATCATMAIAITPIQAEANDAQNQEASKQTIVGAVASVVGAAEGVGKGGCLEYSYDLGITEIEAFKIYNNCEGVSIWKDHIEDDWLGFKCYLKITADAGYKLPESIQVEGADYTYSPEKNEIMVKYNAFTDNVTISGAAVEKEEVVETYKVRFDSNGGKGTMADGEAPKDSSYTLPECKFTPPAGCEFVGWLVNGETCDEGKTINVTENVTVEAQWKEEETVYHTLTFEKNFGDGETKQVEVEDGNYKLPGKQYFEAPEGHELIGWEIDGTEYKLGDTISVGSDMTAKAIWDTIDYKVTFSTDIGSGGMEQDICSYGSTYKLPGNEGFKADGHEFIGWLINDKEYKVTEEITIRGDVEVKANWQKDAEEPYTVTFTGGTADGEMEPVTVQKGDDYTLPTCEFTTPDRCNFKGWIVGGVEYNPGDTIPVKKDVIVEAKWEGISVDTYTVSFHENGGTLTHDSPIKRKAGKYILPSADYIIPPTGSVLHCWEIKDDGQYSAEADYTLDRDITIIPIWKKAPYTVKGNFEHIEELLWDDRTVEQDSSYRVLLKAKSGYELPDEIKVTVNGRVLDVNTKIGRDYSYHKDTGEINIYNTSIDGNIVITAKAEKIKVQKPAKYDIELNGLEGINVIDNVETIKDGEGYYVKFEAKKGYTLPTDLEEVILNNVPVEEYRTTYIYKVSENGQEAVFSINNDVIKGDLAITLNGVQNEHEVSLVSEGATIPEADKLVKAGDACEISVILNEGYTLAGDVKVFIGGEEISRDKYNFIIENNEGTLMFKKGMIYADVEIEVETTTIETDGEDSEKEEVKAKKVSVNLDGLNNISSSNQKTKVNNDEAYKTILSAIDGYKLPETITVQVSGNDLKVGEGYSYSSTTGELSIKKAKLTGTVRIIALGVEIQPVVKEYDLKIDLPNIEAPEAGDKISDEKDYELTLTAVDGYELPESIIVEVAGKTLDVGERLDYTYSSESGKIVINKACINGIVKIEAEGILIVNKCDVVLSIEKVESSRKAAKVNDNKDYTTTLKAADGYKLPDTITVEMDGVELKATKLEYSYDATTGNVLIKADKLGKTLKITAKGEKLPEVVNKYEVETGLENVTSKNQAKLAADNKDYTTTLIAADGYELPESITVEVAGKTLEAGERLDYTYSSQSGKVVVNKACINGIVKIEAEGILIVNKCNVALNLENIESSKTATKVNDNKDYTTTLEAADGYELPDTITVEMDGVELKATKLEYSYDATTGNVLIKADKLGKTLKVTAKGEKLPEAVRNCNVVTELVNVVSENETKSVPDNAPYTTTLKAVDGYEIVEDITVKVAGNKLTSGIDYKYDSTEGTLIIPQNSLTGTIEIYASAELIVNKYNVVLNLENVESSKTATKVNDNKDYTTTLEAADGYEMVGDVKVKVAGNELKAGVDYSYDSESGTLTIPKEKLTGTVEISATGEEIPEEVNKYKVATELVNVTSKNQAKLAADNKDYTTTLAALPGYKLPESITVKVAGKELKATKLEYSYDIKTGKVRVKADKLVGQIEIIASGVKMVNEYNVENAFTNVIGLDTKNVAVDNADYKLKLVPVTGYYLPVVVTVSVAGKELKYGEDFYYNSQEGDIVIRKESISGDIRIKADGIRRLMTYEVNFHANGASGIMMTREVRENQQCVLPACYFVAQKGKVFKAWSINGAQYSPGSVYMPQRDTEVYAIWIDDKEEKTDKEKYWYDGYDVRYKYHPAYWYYYTRDIEFGINTDSYVVRGNSIEFEVSEPILNYSSIRVDGKRVDTRYMDILDDASVLVLNRYFTDNLSEGRHELEIRFNEQILRTTFQVGKKSVEYKAPIIYTGQVFKDVPQNKWYYQDVMYVKAHGIMNGTSKDRFDPNKFTNRAMICQIIYNMDGGNGDYRYGSSFADVKNNQWYYSAINWAVRNNICNGYEDARFRPKNTITREELATILCNYARYRGYNAAASNYSKWFADSAQISPWAEDAMNWATENGIIGGKGNGILDPKGNATRAEIAAIIRRFMEKY